MQVIRGGIEERKRESRKGEKEVDNIGEGMKWKVNV